MVFVLLVKPHNYAALLASFRCKDAQLCVSTCGRLLLYSRIIMRLYLWPIAICTDAQLCVCTIVRLYLPTTSSYRSAKCLYAFSLMIIPLSTITPIAKAIPVSDMIFELIPKALSKIKLAAMVIGI